MSEELEKRVAVLEMEHACAQDELADRGGELVRSQRHHAVFCLVLKELVGDVLKERALGGTLVESVPRYVELARLFADLAYPPPKGEP